VKTNYFESHHFGIETGAVQEGTATALQALNRTTLELKPGRAKSNSKKNRFESHHFGIETAS